MPDPSQPLSIFEKAIGGRIPVLTLVDEALNPVFGEWDYPTAETRAEAKDPDEYFRRNFPILQSIRARHEEVILRLKSYLGYVKDEPLAREIQAEIDRRSAAITKQERKEKK